MEARIGALVVEKQGFGREFLFDSTPPRLYYTAPMSRDRAQWLEVAALVARSTPVDFEFRLEAFPRIAPLLARAGGTASGQFRFHRFTAEESTAAFDAADGTVSAKLVLTCQRCLGNVEVAVQERCSLGFVEDEESIGGIPPSHDPVVMSQGRVALEELVEEQLLLAIPLAPMHADAANCESAERKPAVEEGVAAPTAQRPFAGLRDLMKK